MNNTVNKIIKEEINKLTISIINENSKDRATNSFDEIKTNHHPTVLYHKSPVYCRELILKNGLVPYVGDSYKAHWDDREDLTPYVFLYDHNTIRGGEYDSTYDDDIYAVDASQLDKKHLFNDPDESMAGCYAYDIPIPTSAIKLVYMGSENDSDDKSIAKHSHIYR